jgi:hypothetical protein
MDCTIFFNFAFMQKIIGILFLLIVIFSSITVSQPLAPVYFKGAIKEKKIALQRNIIQNTITKNLSLPLNEATEDNWMDAFWGMELLNYQSPWAEGKIYLAFDSIEKRSDGFQRALVELVYANYPDRFIKQVTSLQNTATCAKVFAMSTEYLRINNKNVLSNFQLDSKKTQLIKSEKDEAILQQLSFRLQHASPQTNNAAIGAIAGLDFLPNHTVLYSFQRKNRNYPGLAMIRDSAGNFIKDEYGGVFSVPQLARSISNLPGYLTNGNTPQGIFRMHGFDSSTTTFIGPTTNIQLTMPFETNIPHFMMDSTITDSIWTEDWYKQLLPANLKNYRPLFESFYAGKTGRTEIIAHGTTVDPEYYAGKLYYPQTPTMGCLCTKEIWSETDGRRLQSDQQRLVAALQKAGGANGYCVVIEIGDEEKAITIDDILSLLKLAK